MNVTISFASCLETSALLHILQLITMLISLQPLSIPALNTAGGRIIDVRLECGSVSHWVTSQGVMLKFDTETYHIGCDMGVCS